jgi:hypothetical protein
VLFFLSAALGSEAGLTFSLRPSLLSPCRCEPENSRPSEEEDETSVETLRESRERMRSTSGQSVEVFLRRRGGLWEGERRKVREGESGVEGDSE